MNRLLRSARLLERAAHLQRLGLPLVAGETAALQLLLPPSAAASAAQGLPAAAACLQLRWLAAPRAKGAPAGSYAAPAGGGMRPMNVRVTMVSSNLLAEPYRGEPPRLPLSAWVTPGGWRERWRRWVAGVKSLYAVSKCSRLIPGWTLPGFKADALAVYQEACAALAAGDLTSLRQLATPAVFGDMKKQIKQREEGGWARVDWALPSPPALKELEVVQGRMIAADPKDDATAFAQLTVRVRSRQRFAAYDRRGRLAAGSPAQEVEVDDCWVFERPLKPKGPARWRVAGRLTFPRAGAPAPAATPAAAAAAQRRQVGAAAAPGTG
jgi:large subunit ribosomal protein L45